MKITRKGVCQTLGGIIFTVCIFTTKSPTFNDWWWPMYFVGLCLLLVGVLWP